MVSTVENNAKGCPEHRDHNRFEMVTMIYMFIMD
jgi:hypothetical protein